MKIGNIDFDQKKVLAASGVMGFFGKGYWHHIPFKPFGCRFDDVIFVSKTATLMPRKGNTRLTKQFNLINPFPRCIRVHPRKKLMLNAIGLSNPGIATLLATGKWQKRTEPFAISIMSVAETPEKRLEELRILIDIVGLQLNEFQAPFFLQINLSCPNTEHDPRILIGESARVLEVASRLGVPIMLKYSIASAPIEAVMELNDNPLCDAICVSNTIPFGSELIDWKKVWGSIVSPLARFGGGGLSGEALLPLVTNWIAELRDAGFTKHINGGGGIMDRTGIKAYSRAGADSFMIGTIATPRGKPWNVQEVSRYGNQLDIRR